MDKGDDEGTPAKRGRGRPKKDDPDDAPEPEQLTPMVRPKRNAPSKKYEDFVSLGYGKKEHTEPRDEVADDDNSSIEPEPSKKIKTEVKAANVGQEETPSKRGRGRPAKNSNATPKAAAKAKSEESTDDTEKRALAQASTSTPKGRGRPKKIAQHESEDVAVTSVVVGKKRGRGRPPKDPSTTPKVKAVTLPKKPPKEVEEDEGDEDEGDEEEEDEEEEDEEEEDLNKPRSARKARKKASQFMADYIMHEEELKKESGDLSFESSGDDASLPSESSDEDEDVPPIMKKSKFDKVEIPVPQIKVIQSHQSPAIKIVHGSSPGSVKKITIEKPAQSLLAGKTLFPRTAITSSVGSSTASTPASPVVISPTGSGEPRKRLVIKTKDGKYIALPSNMSSQQLQLGGQMKLVQVPGTPGKFTLKKVDDLTSPTGPVKIIKAATPGAASSSSDPTSPVKINMAGARQIIVKKAPGDDSTGMKQIIVKKIPAPPQESSDSEPESEGKAPAEPVTTVKISSPTSGTPQPKVQVVFPPNAGVLKGSPQVIKAGDVSGLPAGTDLKNMNVRIVTKDGTPIQQQQKLVTVRKADGTIVTMASMSNLQRLGSAGISTLSKGADDQQDPKQISIVRTLLTDKNKDGQKQIIVQTHGKKEEDDDDDDNEDVGEDEDDDEDAANRPNPQISLTKVVSGKPVSKPEQKSKLFETCEFKWDFKPSTPLQMDELLLYALLHMQGALMDQQAEQREEDDYTIERCVNVMSELSSEELSTGEIMNYLIAMDDLKQPIVGKINRQTRSKFFIQEVESVVKAVSWELAQLLQGNLDADMIANIYGVGKLVCVNAAARLKGLNKPDLKYDLEGSTLDEFRSQLFLWGDSLPKPLQKWACKMVSNDSKQRLTFSRTLYNIFPPYEADMQIVNVVVVLNPSFLFTIYINNKEVEPTAFGYKNQQIHTTQDIAHLLQILDNSFVCCGFPKSEINPVFLGLHTKEKNIYHGKDKAGEPIARIMKSVVFAQNCTTLCNRPTFVKNTINHCTNCRQAYIAIQKLSSSSGSQPKKVQGVRLVDMDKKQLLASANEEKKTTAHLQKQVNRLKTNIAKFCVKGPAVSVSAARPVATTVIGDRDEQQYQQHQQQQNVQQIQVSLTSSLDDAGPSGMMEAGGGDNTVVVTASEAQAGVDAGLNGVNMQDVSSGPGDLEQATSIIMLQSAQRQ